MCHLKDFGKTSKYPTRGGHVGSKYALTSENEASKSNKKPKIGKSVAIDQIQVVSNE